MDYSQFKVRCSSIGKIFTEGRGKDELFGVTAKDELRAMWLLHKYGVDKPSFRGKMVRKGIEQENEGITLYNLVHNTRGRITKMHKNTERRTNDYLTGEMDLGLNKHDTGYKTTIDTKLAWDKHSYFKIIDSIVKKDYVLQGQGYMSLWNADNHIVAHCLINTDDALIKWELYNESKNWPHGEVPRWVSIMKVSAMIHDRKNFERYLQEENLMPDDDNSRAVFESFTEMTNEERVFEFPVERSDETISQIFERVKQCRGYMASNFK